MPLVTQPRGLEVGFGVAVNIGWAGQTIKKKLRKGDFVGNEEQVCV
jgi:hypothetical protein